MMRNCSILLLFCAMLGCTKEIHDGQDMDEFTPDRPDDTDDRNVVTYTGVNPITLDAQARFYTGNDFHRKVIMRSCAGTGGVCHNQKEYPDMHTAESFLSMLDAPCNVNSKTFDAIFDRCERPGDTFSFGDGPESEIGYINFIPGEYEEEEIAPDETSPGLHVILREPISDQIGQTWQDGNFSRRLAHDGEVTPLIFARHSTTWWVISPTHIMGVVYGYQTEAVTDLVAAGIRQGDGNRNGMFGADQGNIVSLLNPGLPAQSYLIGRLTGKMEGQPVPGTRMPLANLPPTTPEMLALACLVEGMPGQGQRSSLSWRIDYASCSYRENPDALSLTGSGVTWSTRVRPLLVANCGGCHGGDDPMAGLDLAGEGAYDYLMGPSTEMPTLDFVVPGNAGSSYLWLKLNNDPSIDGEGMPQDPQLGYRMLAADELADIEAWISAGALEN